MGLSNTPGHRSVSCPANSNLTNAVWELACCWGRAQNPSSFPKCPAWQGIACTRSHLTAHLLCPVESSMPTTHPAPQTHGGYARGPQIISAPGQEQALTLSLLFLQKPCLGDFCARANGSTSQPSHRDPPPAIGTLVPKGSLLPATLCGISAHQHKGRAPGAASSAPATRSSPTPVRCCPWWLRSHLRNWTHSPLGGRGWRSWWHRHPPRLLIHPPLCHTSLRSKITHRRMKLPISWVKLEE